MSYLLLPYVAVAVAGAVVLSQVLLLVSRVAPHEGISTGEEKVDTRASGQALTKPKSPGRPKKEKAAEKESKEATQPVGSTS